MLSIKEDIAQALQVLKAGGVIIYPTDTIWGIGCDDTNLIAVERIYNIKQREDSKSMLVLVNTENMIPSYIEEVPEIAWELLEASDAPMTLIYPGARNLANNLVGSDGTIGIRVSEEVFCKELIGRFRKPIVSTSANVSGNLPPGNFGEIDERLLEQVDYVVKWRQDDYSKNNPSSIIKLGLGGEIEVIRK